MKTDCLLYAVLTTLMLINCSIKEPNSRKIIMNDKKEGDSATIVLLAQGDSNKLFSSKIFTVDFFGDPSYLDLSNSKINIDVSSPLMVNVGIGLSSKQFLLEKGDTVYIKHGKDTTIISSTNIYCTKEDFQSFFNSRYPEFDLLNSTLFTEAYDKRYMNKEYFVYVKKQSVSLARYLEIGKAIKRNNKAKYNKELILLDSLWAIGKVTAAYKQWVAFKIKMDKISDANIVDFFTTERDFISNYNFYNFSEDTLLNSFFYDYKGNLSTNFLYAGVLQYRKIKLANGQSTYNYLSAFDSVDKLITKASADYLKFQCLLRIKEEYSQSTFEKYKNRFYADTYDSTLVNYVRTNLDDTTRLDLSKGDLVRNFNGQIISLNEVITKGKVLFIDFWASWCAPCLNEMPHSFKLQKKFEEGKIDFIYISIDEDFGKWKRAVLEMKMENMKNSYVLINQKNTKIIKSQKINAIPRYIVFDKNGILKNNNAPSPSNPETAKILNELIGY